MHSQVLRTLIFLFSITPAILARNIHIPSQDQEEPAITEATTLFPGPEITAIDKRADTIILDGKSITTIFVTTTIISSENLRSGFWKTTLAEPSDLTVIPYEGQHTSGFWPTTIDVSSDTTITLGENLPRARFFSTTLDEGVTQSEQQQPTGFFSTTLNQGVTPIENQHPTGFFSTTVDVPGSTVDENDLAEAPPITITSTKTSIGTTITTSIGTIAATKTSPSDISDSVVTQAPGPVSPTVKLIPISGDNGIFSTLTTTLTG